MKLAALAPDSARSRQVRADCVRRMERTRRRSQRAATVTRTARRIVAPLAALLGAAYIVSLIAIALEALSAVR